MGKSVSLEKSPWRLIGIKGQSVPFEIPMYVLRACAGEDSIHCCAAEHAALRSFEYADARLVSFSPSVLAPGTRSR